MRRSIIHATVTAALAATLLLASGIVSSSDSESPSMQPVSCCKL